MFKKSRTPMERARAQLEEAFRSLNAEPNDRLGRFATALAIRAVIYQGLVFLDNIVEEGVLEEYEEEDFVMIHESLREMGFVLKQLLEYFLNKAIEEADETLAV